MTEHQIEALRSVLSRVQRMYIEKDGLKIFLLWADEDWLVVMQCLQDHGLFKTTPQRPPLKAFERWVQEMAIPLYESECLADEMTLANAPLRGERYPWKSNAWKPFVLVRWRKLYKVLSKLLEEEVCL